MRTKVTLVLILLNVALFFFIFKFERSWRTEDALREARRRVLGSETANIRALTVKSSMPGGTSFALVRQRDVWVLTEPLDWPANPHAVLGLINALQFLENDTSFSVADLSKSGQSLGDYGLDKPKLTIAFSSGEASDAAAGDAAAGPTTVLQVGDATDVGNRLYILSPDGNRVHVVSRSLLDAFSVPLDQLRADSLLTIRVFEARALSVQTSGARVRIARREGGRWIFDTIVNARASKTEMDLTIDALNSLRAASFPPAPPSVLPSASPSLRVTIDGNGRSETLYFGDPVKPAASGSELPAGGATEYFAQLMNGNTVRDPVFTVAVPNRLLERLRNAPSELRERRILDFDAAAITSVTIAAPNQGQASVTLQRLDASAADSPWQLVRSGEGGAGEQTAAADSVAVRQLLERLTMLSATRFESDAPSNAQNEAWGFNRPQRVITLTTAATPGGSVRPLVLELGTDQQGAVFARVGGPNEPGPSVYAVTTDLAADFPVDAKLWRNRVLQELPPAARVTRVKLTDLSNQSVVFESAIDAAGVPETQARDANAVPTLVKALRGLRARRIVNDRFVDRIVVAGDERTWRYQLDCVVALPSGGEEQVSTHSLLLTERVGGAQQLAGSRQLDVVFELEQPLVDALWSLTYGSRDPGPQLEKK